MFNNVDCVRLQVGDLDSAIDFYGNKLGLEIVWRRGSTEAGLRLLNSLTEIVLVKEELEYPEIDLKVEDVISSVKKFSDAGGKIIIQPFEIKIGRCSVVEDPWNNRLVVLDSSKGLLKVDSNKEVME